jgi:hypothetical protein
MRVTHCRESWTQATLDNGGTSGLLRAHGNKGCPGSMGQMPVIFSKYSDDAERVVVSWVDYSSSSDIPLLQL